MLVHAAATGGRFATAPDSQLYIRLAGAMVQRDLAPMLHMQAVIWTKAVYVALLAAARAIAPAHWMILMIAVNVISSGFVAVMLVDLVQRASGSVVAPIVAWVFYVASYEVVQWMRFVLTDLLYTAVAFAVFYFVARDGPRRRLLLAFLVLLAIFIRPPGIVLVPLVLLSELRARVAATIVVVVAAIAFLIRTAIIDDPARWPFAFFRSKVVQFSTIEKRGEVIDGRRETFRPPPRSPVDHAVIVVDRFARFFQFTTSGFSRAHNIVNAIWFIPIYALGIFAIVRRRALTGLTVMWIAVFALFHALTVIDFDWRHRTPLIPHFIVLAAMGLTLKRGDGEAQLGGKGER